MAGLIRRPRPNAAKIKARVSFAKALAKSIEQDPTIAPLAEGFFALERMRAGRSAGRPKLKG